MRSKRRGMTIRIKFLTVLAQALIILAVPAARGAAGGLPPGMRVVMSRGGREFTADSGGKARINVIFSTPSVDRRGGALARSGRGELRHLFTHFPAATLEVPEDSLAEAVASLESDPDVLTVEPDNPDQRILGQKVPWGVARIHADYVQSSGNRGAGVKVGVLDTGIDYTHPDLKANYRGGRDFANGDADPLDDHGHGTHVSGTIAAADNGYGVVGVAPGALLYALKVFRADGVGYTSWFAAAVDWCIGRGIKVINYSGGSSTGSDLARLACRRAYDAGITIVAASGNEGAASIYYPAAYDKVIAVGSTGSTDARSDFSNYGPGLDVMAPGENILSTIIGGGYSNYWSGTSMATPHVSGVAALLVKRGVTKPDDIMDCISGKAKDLGTPGRDDLTGWGLANARKAMPVGGFLTAPAGGELVASGTTYPVTWAAPDGATQYRLDYSLDNGAHWTLIAEGLSGTGYDWTVLPAPPGNRPKSRVRVTARDAGNVIVGISRSPDPFTIEVVRLDSPAKGDVILAGSAHLITWTVNQTAGEVGVIRLFFSTDKGAHWGKIGPDFPPGTTAWEWPVPAFARKKSACKIRIKLLDGSMAPLGMDANEGVFTILPASP